MNKKTTVIGAHIDDSLIKSEVFFHVVVETKTTLLSTLLICCAISVRKNKK